MRTARVAVSPQRPQHRPTSRADASGPSRASNVAVGRAWIRLPRVALPCPMGLTHTIPSSATTVSGTNPLGASSATTSLPLVSRPLPRSPVGHGSHRTDRIPVVTTNRDVSCQARTWTIWADTVEDPVGAPHARGQGFESPQLHQGKHGQGSKKRGACRARATRRTTTALRGIRPLCCARRRDTRALRYQPTAAPWATALVLQVAIERHLSLFAPC